MEEQDTLGKDTQGNMVFSDTGDTANGMDLRYAEEKVRHLTFVKIS